MPVPVFFFSLFIISFNTFISCLLTSPLCPYTCHSVIVFPLYVVNLTFIFVSSVKFILTLYEINVQGVGNNLWKLHLVQKVKKQNKNILRFMHAILPGGNLSRLYIHTSCYLFKITKKSSFIAAYKLQRYTMMIIRALWESSMALWAERRG